MQKNVFVNFSNHPSNNWEAAQTAAAREYGDIVDIKFPEVDPRSSAEDIRSMGMEYTEMILEYAPAAVMCQGEFTLCYTVINELKKNNVKVLAACARRMVEEKDGVRIARFEFEGFREY